MESKQMTGHSLPSYKIQKALSGLKVNFHHSGLFVFCDPVGIRYPCRLAPAILQNPKALSDLKVNFHHSGLFVFRDPVGIQNMKSYKISKSLKCNDCQQVINVNNCKRFIKIPSKCILVGQFLVILPHGFSKMKRWRE